VFTQAKQNKQT